MPAMEIGDIIAAYGRAGYRRPARYLDKAQPEVPIVLNHRLCATDGPSSVQNADADLLRPDILETEPTITSSFDVLGPIRDISMSQNAPFALSSVRESPRLDTG